MTNQEILEKLNSNDQLQGLFEMAVQAPEEYVSILSVLLEMLMNKKGEK